MSGHSKWANIAHRKGAVDKKRSETFTKLSKNILGAIRAGGGNSSPEANNGLKAAIDRARAANMPKENIERLLANFETKKQNLVNFYLEGFVPSKLGGTMPIMIEVETDKRNRTLGEIRSIIRACGGNLSEEGGVRYVFDRVGEVTVDGLNQDQELAVIEVPGVIDIEGRRIYVKPENMSELVDRAGELGVAIESQMIVMRAKNQGANRPQAELLEKLEANEEVVGVFF